MFERSCHQNQLFKTEIKCPSLIWFAAKQPAGLRQFPHRTESVSLQLDKFIRPVQIINALVRPIGLSQWTFRKKIHLNFKNLRASLKKNYSKVLLIFLKYYSYMNSVFRNNIFSFWDEILIKAKGLWQSFHFWFHIIGIEFIQNRWEKN